MVAAFIFGGAMIVLGLIAMGIRNWTAEQRLRFFQRLSPKAAPSRRILEFDATFGAWLALAIGIVFVVIGILML